MYIEKLVLILLIAAILLGLAWSFEDSGSCSKISVHDSGSIETQQTEFTNVSYDDSRLKQLICYYLLFVFFVFLVVEGHLKGLFFLD